MRYIYLLLVVLIVSSCAHNRIRLRKVDKHDRVVTVENKSYDSDSYKKQEIVDEEEQISENSSKTASNVEKEIETVTTHVLDSEKPSNGPSPDKVNDEIIEEPSNGRKLQQAINAEADARKAKNAFIWSLSMFFVFLIPFVPLLSVIPFIIGSIRLSRSNKSDYITLQGEKYARTARILQLIYGILALISILIITALIILFLL